MLRNGSGRSTAHPFKIRKSNNFRGGIPLTGRYNGHNAEIKCKLKAHSIRYADLVRATGYCRQTILDWLRAPCDASRLTIIERAIAQIEEDRQNGSGHKYTRTLEASDSSTLHQNLDVRLRLDALNISHADLARELGCKRARITYWLRVPLTDERLKVIDRAVEAILERRKNEPPSPPPARKRKPPTRCRSSQEDKNDQRSEKEKTAHQRPKTGQFRYTVDGQSLPWKR